MDYLKDIIADIQEESCVLIVGPDLFDFSGKSLFESFTNELLSNNNYKGIIETPPQYIFPNEELFDVSNARMAAEIFRMMKSFYKKQTTFTDPLIKISQIPFHLIISLFPNDQLREIFTSQNLDYSQGYYPNEEAPSKVEKPTGKKPLLYNLLGDFNENHAIITFEDLFRFLSGIMGDRKLPENILLSLKKAQTLLFLGVHFEKWYVQLLLRCITSKYDKKYKYTILRNTNNKDICTFVARRFELEFLEVEPLQILDTLYNECKQQDLLKTVRSKKKAKIFLSYSHLDKEIALAINKSLAEHNIDVLIDEISMKGGEKIEDFINTIKDVDIVIPIISQNSLLSPWVSKEITTTIDKTNKHLLPCYIDKIFLDNHFETNAKNVVSEKVKTINELISQRGIANTEDLDRDKRIWTEYYSNLPKVLTELNKRKCISLMEAEFEKNIFTVINDVKQIAKAE